MEWIKSCSVRSSRKQCLPDPSLLYTQVAHCLWFGHLTLRDNQVVDSNGEDFRKPLGQLYLTDLSVMMKMFHICTSQHGSHSPHVASKYLNCSLCD